MISAAVPRRHRAARRLDHPRAAVDVRGRAAAASVPSARCRRNRAGSASSAREETSPARRMRPPLPAQGLSLLAVLGEDDPVVGTAPTVGGPGARGGRLRGSPDAWHGHGIATVLLAHLARLRRGRTSRRSRRRPALQPPHAPGFPRLGLPLSVSSVDDFIELEFPTSRRRAAPAIRGSPRAPRTSRQSLTSCDPRRSLSSGRLAGPTPWVARSCATCWPRASRGRCTSSICAAERSPAAPRFARSPTSKATSSSPSSRCPRRRYSRPRRVRGEGRPALVVLTGPCSPRSTRTAAR